MSRKKNQPSSQPLPGEPSDPQGFTVLCGAFFEWMRVKNYSERTVENRQHFLGAFVKCCQERGIAQPAEVTNA